MKRKAQAALEFLSTYGFAFLSLFIVLGIISYFGIFNMSSLRSNECRLPPGLSCRDFVFKSTTIDGSTVGQAGAIPALPFGTQPYMLFIITNNYGVNITGLANAANMSNDITHTTVTCSVVNQAGNGPAYPVYPWEPNQNRTFYCQVPAASFYKAQRYEGTVGFGFTQTSGTYQHHVMGTYSMVAS